MGDDRVDVVELYRHVTQEIRWGKQQQWQLTYYAILLFGAIHLMYSLARHESLISESYLAFGASLFAAAALLIGAAVVGKFQSFLVKNRCILREIYSTKVGDNHKFVTTGFTQVRRHDDLGTGFGEDWSVWISVLFLLFAAAASVQFRGYAGQFLCLILWILIDLAVVAVGILIGYSEAKTEQGRH